MTLIPHRRNKPRKLVFSASLLGCIALVLCVSLCLQATKVLAQAKADKKADEDEIPPPEDIELTTADDVVLKVTCFPGIKRKGSVPIPVILLHGANGSRKDFTEDGGLAPFLQEKLGCFVVIPDLRGHGESKKYKDGKEIGKRMTPAIHQAMVKLDMLAVKEYLWKKNNEHALNLNKLAIVGVDSGAAVALGYAAFDEDGYGFHRRAVGPLQVGKFLKAAVLISPATKIPGLMPTAVLRGTDVWSDLQVMILAGNKDKLRFGDAETLTNLFKKARAPEDKLKIAEKTVIFLPTINTPLQGAKLLAERSLQIPEKIKFFLELRLINNPAAKEKDYAWKELKKPYE